VIADGQVTVERWRAIRELLARHGAVESAFERAVSAVNRAKHHLTTSFAPSVERERLVALADYIVNRDR
jgi:geranylgeranyl pyrophosphate synthase